MKIVPLLTLGCAVLVVDGQAASEQTIKLRAREVTGQSQSAHTNRPPGLSPGPTRSQVVVTSPPAGNFTADQQRALRLHNSITAVRPGVPVDPVQRSQLENDLSAVAAGSQKPSAKNIKKLATSMSDALSQRMLSRPTQARLVQNLALVLNPGTNTAAKVEQTIADTQALFESNNVPKKDAERIAADLKAVAAEVKPK